MLLKGFSSFVASCCFPFNDLDDSISRYCLPEGHPETSWLVLVGANILDGPISGLKARLRPATLLRGFSRIKAKTKTLGFMSNGKLSPRDPEMGITKPPVPSKGEVERARTTSSKFHLLFYFFPLSITLHFSNDEFPIFHLKIPNPLVAAGSQVFRQCGT
jgi:hypothetical protein